MTEKRIPVLMRGPSARTLFKIARLGNAGYLVCLAAALVVVLIGRSDPSMAQALLVLLIGFAIDLALWVAFASAIALEVRHGYTTLDGRFRHLPQLESGTGTILRSAGEPYAEPDERNWRQ